jgi:Ala-tRNA(Pro) deacylase
MAIAETVQRFLELQSINYGLVPHPHTGSSHETAEAAHVSEDHIAKAVIVKDAAGYAMVVVPASNWVEVEHLRKELNRDFHLSTED